MLCETVILHTIQIVPNNFERYSSHLVLQSVDEWILVECRVFEGRLATEIGRKSLWTRMKISCTIDN